MDGTGRKMEKIWRRGLILGMTGLLLTVSSVCAQFDFQVEGKKTMSAKPAGIKLRSPAFEDSGIIPKLYTCDGEDISPQLEWSGVPEDAVSLALIVDDPDAPMGTFVHWVLYNLPANITALPERMPSDAKLETGALQGKTDFGKKPGYGGPCPPAGTHRYFFKLYALDTNLPLEPGATKKQLLKAMEGHILSEGQLVGHYQRQASASRR